MLRLLTIIFSLQILIIGCSNQFYHDSAKGYHELSQVFYGDSDVSSAIITAPPEYCNGCKDGNVILGEFFLNLGSIDKATNRLIISGQLFDMHSKEQLQAGQILILDSDKVSLESTISDETGKFEISSNLSDSEFIQLKSVGFRTILIDIKVVLNSL
jgi:hypothetical protein